MPAEIETMAYAEATGKPWHPWGNPFPEGMSTEEVIKASGLGWTVHTEEMSTFSGLYIPGRRAVVREGDIPVGVNRVLGVVGTDYVPVNNFEGFAFLEGLVKDGVIEWETAMAIKGGTVVCMMARMAGDWTIGDDKHTTYIAFTMGHDGGLSIGAMGTDIRIVCANTHKMAFGVKNKNAMIKIRHSGDVAGKMNEAQKVMQITTGQQRAYQEWLAGIQAEELDRVATEAAIFEVFGNPKDAQTPRIGDQIQKRLDAFNSTYLAPELVRGGHNGYSLLNAFTGYADHGMRYNGDSTKQAETRFATSVIGGRGVDFKDKAALVVSRLTGVRLAL